jgi:hypothetical protein
VTPHLWQAMVATMTSWHQGKLFIEHSLALSHDSIHILAGVLLWLVLGLLLRRPLGFWGPWLWLFAIILWNETVDLWIEQWPDPGQQYGEGARDLLLTMFVPTIIMIAIRRRPDLFRQSGAKRRHS